MKINQQDIPLFSINNKEVRVFKDGGDIKTCTDRTTTKNGTRQTKMRFLLLLNCMGKFLENT